MILKSKFIYNTGTSEEAAGGNNTVRTNEQIDKQNELRKTLGQEPLPYETTEVKATTTTAQEITDTRSPEEIAAAKIEEDAQKLVIARAAEIEKEQNAEKERLRLLALEEKGENVLKITKVAPVVEKTKQNESVDEDDIDTEKLLKALSKVTGRTISSLEELEVPKQELTKEQLEKRAQERETAKMEFGLKNKIISKDQIESFLSDKNNPTEVAYSVYATNIKDLNPELTDKQIRERFEERYSLNEDEDSVEFKAGQGELNLIAKTAIERNHSDYLSLESKYAAFEQSQTKEAERKASILKKAPQFRNDIKAVAERCKNITVAGKKVEIGDDIIGEYVNEIFASPETESIIENGYTLEGLENALKDKIVKDNLDNIVTGLIDAAVLKAQAGVRGVIPEKKTGLSKVYNELKGEDAKKDLHERLGMTSS